MTIRMLRATDLEQASAVCMAAFRHSVAGTLPAAGICTFTEIASPDGFAGRMCDANTMLVFEMDGRVQGVAELSGGQHVAMLFVDPTCQRQGVGRALMAALIECARADVLTVRAALGSVPAYQRYGFRMAGAVGEQAGLRYQPMELALPPHAAQGSER